MELITPEGRVISDEPEYGQITALAERARHLAEVLNQVKKALTLYGAALSVEEVSDGFEDMLKVSIRKTVEY